MVFSTEFSKHQHPSRTRCGLFCLCNDQPEEESLQNSEAYLLVIILAVGLVMVVLLCHCSPYLVGGKVRVFAISIAGCYWIAPPAPQREAPLLQGRSIFGTRAVLAPSWPAICPQGWMRMYLGSFYCPRAVLLQKGNQDLPAWPNELRWQKKLMGFLPILLHVHTFIFAKYR